jgi:hypothetical protein
MGVARRTGFLLFLFFFCVGAVGPFGAFEGGSGRDWGQEDYADGMGNCLREESRSGQKKNPGSCEPGFLFNAGSDLLSR